MYMPMAWIRTKRIGVTKIIGNNFVDLAEYVDFDTSDLKVTDKVFYPVLREILDACGSQEDDSKRC